MSLLDTLQGNAKPNSAVYRLLIHAASGGLTIGCMAATYLSLQPFINNSQASWAPASMFFHCFLLPGTLAVLYHWNLYMLTDAIMPPLFKLGFLLAELCVDFAIIGMSAQNPVFACGISGCTYDVLPPVTLADQLVQTWDSPSGTAVMALLYFTLSIALLPLLLWLAHQQWQAHMAGAAFMRDSSVAKLATPVKDLEGVGIEMRPMQSNPMFVDNPMMSNKKSSSRGKSGNAANGSPGYHDDETKEGPGSSKRRGGSGGAGGSIAAPNSSSQTEKKGAKLFLPWQQHLVNIERRRWWMWAYIVGALLVLWPVNLFCTSRFGNDFQWFSNYGIAAWAKHIIKPAIPQVTISKLLNYKFFPQIIIFYCYIYGIVVVALLAKMYPSLRKFFSWRPTVFGKVPLMDRCTMGEFLMAAVFLIFSFATFSYTFWNWYGIPHIKWKGSPMTERWGRCLGQSSLFPMGAMVLPISRNSIWAKLLDYPWDGMIKFHKWMSITFLVISTGHMIAFWFCFNTLSIFPQALFSSPNAYRAEDSTIGMMSGLVFFVLLPVFGILTLDWVRRSRFELFYYTHMLSSVIFLATLWHADFAWMYLLPGLTMWLIDHCLRLSNSVRNFEVVGLRDVGDSIVELEFAIKRNPYAPLDALPFESGQYVFVNIPDISPLQSHPFNISGSSFDKTNVLHIKSCGAGTWTGDLLDLSRLVTRTNEQAAEGGQGQHGHGTKQCKPFPLQRLGITIDGPYGTGLPWMRCTNILLIGGGVGVTPLHSLLRSLLQLQQGKNGMPHGCKLGKIRLVWTFRNEDLIAKNRMFMSTLCMIPASDAQTALLGGGGRGAGPSRAPAAKKAAPAPAPAPAPASAEKTPKAKHSSGSRSQVTPAGLVGKTLYADASSSSDDEQEEEGYQDDQQEQEGESAGECPSLHSPHRDPNPETVLSDGAQQGKEGSSSGSCDGNGALKGSRGSGRGAGPRQVMFEVSLHCTASPASKALAFQNHAHTSVAMITQLQLDVAMLEQGVPKFPHPIIHARPDIKREIAALGGDSEALCFCVGPDALVSSVREECSEQGIEFRGENAEL